MLTFKDNFFFVKFSVFFFLVTIFGYWGIDLNSEELYIAFSFFFLVIVAVVLFSASLLVFFANVLNSRYASLLKDNLIVVSALSLVSELLSQALYLLTFVVSTQVLLVNLVLAVFGVRLSVIREFFVVSGGLLRVLFSVAVQFFASSVVSTFRFSFSLPEISSFFSIKL